MAYAVERLIENFKKQIELAPKLEENTAAGGNFCQTSEGDMRPNMVTVLTDGMNRANDIPILRAVEFGPRRYADAFDAAQFKATKLAKIFTELRSVHNANYADGEQRQRAISRYQPKTKEIVELCEGAIADLEVALSVLHEGEGRTAKSNSKNPVMAGK